MSWASAISSYFTGPAKQEVKQEDGVLEEDGDSTPKASAAQPMIEVPSFTLDGDNTDTSQGGAASLDTGSNEAPVTPVPKAYERSAATSTGSKAISASLMPPPSAMGPPKLSPAATSRNALRPPSNGPLPNRGPPSAQKAASGGGLAPAAMANTAGKRNKVILKPGHSPLDWATLAKTTNLSGVPTMQRVTPSMLKYHHGRKGRPAWSSYRGKVYNISPYLPFHPGGEGELMRGAGKDGEKLFNEIHAWVNWETMLSSCLVGIMVSEGDGEGLDGLD